MAPPRGKIQVKLNASLFAMTIEEMMSGPTTAQAISDLTGMSIVTVWHLLRALKARKVIHIASYDDDAQGRKVVRVFGFGPGRDAKRPTPTRAERARRNRERQTALKLGGNMYAGLML
jgi:hypothetical protein